MSPSWLANVAVPALFVLIGIAVLFVKINTEAISASSNPLIRLYRYAWWRYAQAAFLFLLAFIMWQAR